MAADGHDDVGKEQWEFSRRRFLRYAGGAAAAGSAYAGLAGLLGAEGANAASAGARKQRHRVLREPPEVQVRDGQPRDDELVLHGDDLRAPGRLRHHRLLVPVDRLDDLDRQRDGLGD